MSDKPNQTKYEVDSKKFKASQEGHSNYSQMIYAGVSQFLGADGSAERTPPNEEMIAFLLDTKVLKATSK